MNIPIFTPQLADDLIKVFEKHGFTVAVTKATLPNLPEGVMMASVEGPRNDAVADQHN